MRRIVLVLLLSVCAFAAESKDLAFRAEKALKAGKFSKANALYERALLSSRKESDLESEGRILIAMASLRTRSLDLEFAERLLSSVRKTELDTASLSAYSLAWMELFLEKRKYDKVIEIKYSMSEKFLKRIPDGILGNILCVAAVAFAGNGDAELSERYLIDGEKAFGGEAPGTVAFAAARSAELLRNPEADSLFEAALKHSIRAGRPFMSATILYYRALGESQSQVALDYLVRCANAFDLMGLSRNRDRADSLSKAVRFKESW